MKKYLSSALGLGGKCKVEVEFDSAERPGPLGPPGSSSVVPCFTNNDTVAGTIRLIPLSLKKVDHLGVRVQLVGEVVLKSDKHRPHEFLSVVRDVAPPGDLTAIETVRFEFEDVQMPYESYSGSQVTLRYSVRVIVARSMGQTLIQDHFFDVQNPTTRVEDGTGDGSGDGSGERGEGGEGGEGGETGATETAATATTRPTPPSDNNKIKMEVGIEDCLHIEFEYRKHTYHLRDVVIGRINFMLVKIKLKHMELEIKRRETVGSGINARLESSTVAKYEIMDGAPARGESIPIRMYLSPYPLTPSYDNVCDKFSVKYSLNLVLVDEEDRRYFKQHEITLVRLTDEACGPPAWNLIKGGRDDSDATADAPVDAPMDDLPRETNGNGNGIGNVDDVPDEDGMTAIAL